MSSKAIQGNAGKLQTTGRNDRTSQIILCHSQKIYPQQNHCRFRLKPINLAKYKGTPEENPTYYVFHLRQKIQEDI